MAGRTRLSDAVKAERKTLRAGRRNLLAPAVEPIDIPDPPPELDEHTARVWHRQAAELGPAKVVGTSDMAGFRLLVAAVARAELADADPEASVGEKCRAAASALAFLSAFGCVPTARERAAKAKPAAPERDPLDEFVFRS